MQIDFENPEAVSSSIKDNDVIQVVFKNLKLLISEETHLPLQISNNGT